MDSTHRWTKAQLAEMEDHLSRIYAEANGDIEKKLFDHLEKFKKMDEQKRKEVEKAQKQGAENAEELFEEWKRWRRTQMFQGQNWRNKLSELTRQYLEVNKTALAYVNGEMSKIAARNYNAFEDEANDAAAKYGLNEYSFNLVDEHTIKKLATENETLLPYKIVDGKKDVRWNTDKINAQMLQGILQGEDIPTIASRLQNVTEMNRASAIRNARTMTTSAECAGRQMSYTEAEKDGMIIEREWLCTADSRRRDWHWDLNGTFTKVNEPWENDFGKIMYPGDPNAKPQNVYNCRCSIAAKVVGFEKSQGEKAVVEKQTEAPSITTREQAYKALIDDIGFSSVSDNVSVIDEKLLAENVTQLKKLNDRFGALTAENKGYFTATSAKNAVAYSQGSFRNLNNQSMSLCGSSYGFGYDYFVSKERDFVSTNWNMPCLDKNLPIYTVTHEYGHIFENKVIHGRVDINAFEKAYKAKNSARIFLEKEAAKQAKIIWQEIIQIAKEENPDFLVSKNISKYGKTNYFEAFAETFANSQCGSPNELGRAMNIWLERNGY